MIAALLLFSAAAVAPPSFALPRRNKGFGLGMFPPQIPSFVTPPHVTFLPWITMDEAFYSDEAATTEPAKRLANGTMSNGTKTEDPKGKKVGNGTAESTRPTRPPMPSNLSNKPFTCVEATGRLPEEDGGEPSCLNGQCLNGQCFPATPFTSRFGVKFPPTKCATRLQCHFPDLCIHGWCTDLKLMLKECRHKFDCKKEKIAKDCVSGYCREVDMNLDSIEQPQQTDVLNFPGSLSSPNFL